MTIFERIRNKAQQAFQGASNFVGDARNRAKERNAQIIQNVSSTPFTDARGVNTTVGQRLGETYSDFKQNSDNYNIFSSIRKHGLGTGIEWLDNPVKQIGETTPLKFFESRVIDPLLKVPANTEIALDPTKSKLERGIGGLSAGAAFLPGIDDAVVATVQHLQEKATGGNKDVLTTDYQPTPLGDILRNRGADGMGATALDFAELPLMLGSVLATGKGADALAKRADDLAPIAARQADDFATQPTKGVEQFTNPNDYITRFEGGSSANAPLNTHKNPTQLKIDDAVKTIREKVNDSALRGWFLEADSNYKPRLLRDINDPDVLNAGHSIAYDTYKTLTRGSENLTYDQFLNNPIILYRAGKLAPEEGFSSFTMFRDVAEKFARQKGGVEITEIVIKPKDTFGSFQTTAEGEILVPSSQLTDLYNQAQPTKGVEALIQQANDAISPASKEVIETTSKQLPSAKIPYALPAPDQTGLTLTQIKKLAKQGDSLDGVKFTAKNAREVREAVTAGLRLDQIEIAPKLLKQTDDVLQFPQDEAALWLKPKTGVQGVKKSGLARAWDDVAHSSKGVIERSGASGKRIRATLDAADEEGSMVAGAQLDTMHKALRGLSKQEKAGLADVIEGTAKPVSEAQAAAAAVWKNIAADIHGRAIEQGLDIGEIENYFPHHILKGDDAAARAAMARTAPRRYGNLELSRQSDLPYDKDPSVLMDYIESANKRIVEAKHFGANDELLYNLANNVAKEGGDSQQVVKYLDQILGKEQDAAGKALSENIRSAQTVLKLNPGTAVTNLTQNISTLFRTDATSTAKSIYKTITKPDEAFSNARRVGEISTDEARVLADYAGQGNVVTKWLRAIGMLGAEKINRVIAVNAGMEYTTKLAKQAQAGDKAALRELKRLGMSLDDVDPLKGGLRISRETQFTTAPGELPYGWHTPLGKIMTQFKSFAYKQSTMLKNEAVRVAQEAKAGNLKPLGNALIAYGVAAPVVGEITNDVKALLTNKKRESEFLSAERYIENILGATSFGLLDSTEGLFGKYGAAGVISTLGGVTAGDIYKGAESIAGLTSDDEYDKRKAARFATNQIPYGVGRAISNTVIPNAYVDNLFGGVNEGLGEKDKTTYNNLKGSDPTGAEAFKQGKIEDRKEPNFLQKMFGGNEITAAVPGSDATPEERKEFNTQVSDMLDAGGVPDATVLKQYVTKGNDIKSKSIEERTKAYSGLKTAMNNEYYSEEQKQAILASSGVDPQNYDYYELASKDQDVRLQELLPKLDNMDDAAKLEFLMQGRKAIAGKQLVSNTMADYLYEMDYLTDNERDAIKALKYDEVNEKYYFSKSFKKKGSGGSLTYKQALKLFEVPIPKFSSLKSLDSILANYGTRSSQTGRSGDTLLDNILSSKPTNISHSKDLWF